MAQEYSRAEHYTRITWLMLSRMVLTTLLLGSLFLFQYRYHLFQFNVVYLLYFAVSVYLLSGIYWFVLKTSGRLPILVTVQMAVDSVLITWLVSLTGGIDSGFSILYHISIIASNILLYRRGGYISASLASILYGTVLDMQYYNMFGFARSQNFTVGQVLYLLFVNILSFYLVALLSGYLADRLRRTRIELQEKSTNYNDLQTLQEHILKSVGSGIVTLDMQGMITSWNNAAEMITGLTLDDVRGHAKPFFNESIKGLFGQTDELRLRPVRFDGQMRKPDGGRIVLGFTASLLKDDHDNVRGIILTFQDITRLIEMEEKVRRQERLATVGSLAAGIAHEIRNPLASLSGSIQMLKEGTSLTGDQRQLMDIVLRETDRLNTIISEFLEYARPRPAHQVPVDLGPLIKETLVLFRNSREFRDDMTISSSCEPGLVIAADPQGLRQVLWNLLINAAQAIADGGAISISADRVAAGQGQEVLITVADTGKGIDPTDREKIFDPFFTTKAQGTGLGLAIVYRIVHDHGGHISVSSERQQGSCFSVRLPFAAGADESGGKGMERSNGSGMP